MQNEKIPCWLSVLYDTQIRRIYFENSCRINEKWCQLREKDNRFYYLNCYKSTLNVFRLQKSVLEFHLSHFQQGNFLNPLKNFSNLDVFEFEQLNIGKLYTLLQ